LHLLKFDFIYKPDFFRWNALEILLNERRTVLRWDI